MKKEKIAAKYTKMFAKEMKHWTHENVYNEFYEYYLSLLNSNKYDEYFKSYKHVPTDVTLFAVAVSLYTKNKGYKYEETLAIFSCIAHKKRSFFRRLLNFIERLPLKFKTFLKLYKKVQIEPYDANEIKYEFVNEYEDKFEYKIKECAFIKIFDDFGIRKYCKILCDSDVDILGGMHKHVKFIRHEDLSTGNSCHDEVVKVKKENPRKK